MARTPEAESSGDPEIVRRAIRGFQEGARKEDSFRVLHEIYYRPVLAFFCKRLRAADECLDLTQDTFVRVYKGLRGYRSDGPFGAWLFRIAGNVLRTRQAKNAVAALRERRVPLGAALETEAAGDDPGREEIAGEGTERSAFDRVARQQERQILRRAIDELPLQRRRCMVLWAYRELSYEEIAQVMQLSIGTIKAHLAQARRQLENLLADRAAEKADP